MAVKEKFPSTLQIFRQDRKMTFGDHVDQNPDDWAAYIRADTATAMSPAMRCAECFCDNGGDECRWIKSGPSPAEIAEILTPAQVRALKDCAATSHLRNPELVAFDCRILPFERAHQVRLLGFNLSPTPLGLAVLAELERMGK